MQGSVRARAVRKYEVIESIQFSIDSYLFRANNVAR